MILVSHVISLSMRWMVFGILCFLFSVARAYDGTEELSIGILSPYDPAGIQIIPDSGAYAVIADGKRLGIIHQGDRVSLKLDNGSVGVRLGESYNPGYRDVRLMSLNSYGFFRIYLIHPKKHEAVYDDHLQVLPGKGELKLINRVSLEKYVAGVVEAESGKGNDLAFYKVQAIISRTYALSNQRKHLAEGFNLNDQVDCQVYHGKSRWEPLILDAVRLTHGKVLVDSEMNLITAAFHSNSGGETVGSDVVWSGALPYLSPKRDEFSRMGSHYRWEVMISEEKWLNYLEEKFDLPVSDELIRTMATNYEQKNRHIFFVDPIFDIPLTEIRSDWSLKSTFFNIADEGDSLRFSGRGFGHGTGLSQEGAMRMAELGFTYKDILHFYYNDVHVIDLHALAFFREE